MNNSKKIAAGAAAIAAVIAAGVFFAVIKPANDRKIAEAKETERLAAYEACKKAVSEGEDADYKWDKAYSDASWLKTDKIADKKLADEFTEIKYAYVSGKNMSAIVASKEKGSPSIEMPNVDCKTDDSTEILKSVQIKWQNFNRQLEEKTSALKQKTEEVKKAYESQ